MDSAGYYHLNRPHYKLQVNDILSINVRSYSEEANKAFNQNSNLNMGMGANESFFFLNGYTVSPDGNIEVPVLGKVFVLGLTIEEIQEVFQRKLDQYFQHGAVIAHVQLAGIRFTVVGDVQAPGRYVIYQSQVNIFEALASAGDVTLVGDRRQVQIIRQFPEGARLYDLDLTRQSAINDPRFFIQPNDIVNVKPLRQKSWGIGTTGIQTLTLTLGAVASVLLIITSINTLRSNN
jgi:polysaccharide export outer membrane protein